MAPVTLDVRGERDERCLEDRPGMNDQAEANSRSRGGGCISGSVRLVRVVLVRLQIVLGGAVSDGGSLLLPGELRVSLVLVYS